MVLPVAVEIAPADAPREQVQVLLAACTRAKRGGECVLAAEAPSGGSSAVAIVTWQGSARALIEVGLRREGQPEWRARSLDFDPARDDLLERWRAVGLVVGTLANEEIEAAERAADVKDGVGATAPTSRPKAPERGPRSQAETTTDADADAEAADDDEAPVDRALEPVLARLDVGAAIGPAFEAIRFGGLVRAELPLPDPLRLQFTARYLEHPRGTSELRAQWVTGSIGLGAGVGSERFEASVAVDARGEYFGARAERGEEAEARTRWLSGVGFGTSVAWIPSASLGLFVGADLASMFGNTEVWVAGEPAGEDGAWRYAAEAGVRFRLR